MAAKPSHKAIRPLQRCQACGSSWFREIEVQQYSEIYADYRLSAPAWILVCLCGTPVRPNLGGVRAGRTPNLQTVALMDSMACAGEQVRKEQDAEAVLQPYREQAVTRTELNNAEKRLRRVEQAIRRKKAEYDETRSSPRGRNWRMPERKPVSRGRDAQVAALQEKGLTFRQARRAVNAVWDVIKAALQRDEEVETPLGTFRPVLVLRAAKLVQRFGKRQMRKQTFRITVKLVPPGSKRWSRP